jgi:hypothetical protein
MPNPTQRRATRTAPTRTNDARTAHPDNRAHRAPTRAPCAPLPETKRTRTRATTTSWVSLESLVTIVHNSTLVLVGMIIVLSGTPVLARMVPILSSIFVLLVFLYYWYACTIVSLYYSKYVLLVRLYYSIFVLLKMILIISSTPVLQYACTIENDSHSY